MLADKILSMGLLKVSSMLGVLSPLEFPIDILKTSILSAEKTPLMVWYCVTAWNFLHVHIM